MTASLLLVLTLLTLGGVNPDEFARLANQAPQTVVLVHGYARTSADWDGYKAHLEAQGYVVYAPALPGSDNETNATYLRDYIQDLGEGPVLVQAHSMGAVAMLYCVKNVPGCISLVSSLTVIDAPMNGFPLACLLPMPTGAQLCTVWPWNGWMTALHMGDDTPGNIWYGQILNSHWTSLLWPAAQLDGGVACTERVSIDHFTMLTDPKIFPTLQSMLEGECP